MPWLNKIPYDDRHICKMPKVDEAGVGSTWECDVCKSAYKIVQKFFGDRRKWQRVARASNPSAPDHYVPPPPVPGPSGTSAGRTPRPPAPSRASSSDAAMPWDGLPGIRAAGGKTTELSSDETPKPPVGASPSGRKPVTVPPYYRVSREHLDESTDISQQVFGAITEHEKRHIQEIDEEIHHIISEREFLGYRPLDVPIYLKD